MEELPVPQYLQCCFEGHGEGHMEAPLVVLAPLLSLQPQQCCFGGHGEDRDRGLLVVLAPLLFLRPQQCYPEDLEEALGIPFAVLAEVLSEDREPPSQDQYRKSERLL